MKKLSSLFLMAVLGIASLLFSSALATAMFTHSAQAADASLAENPAAPQTKWLCPHPGTTQNGVRYGNDARCWRQQEEYRRELNRREQQRADDRRREDRQHSDRQYEQQRYEQQRRWNNRVQEREYQRRRERARDRSH